MATLFKTLFKTLFIISVISISTQLSAQYVHFGVKGGINFSNIYGAEGGTHFSSVYGTDGGSFRLVGQGGIMVSYLINPKLQGQVELSLIGSGTRLSDEVIFLSTYLSYSHNFRIIRYSGWFFEIGPQLSLWVDGGLYSSADIITDDVMPVGVKPIDFGINAGIGYTTHFGLGFNLRYYQGLINLSDETYDETISGVNGQVQISVEYTFGYSKRNLPKVKPMRF